MPMSKGIATTRARIRKPSFCGALRDIEYSLLVSVGVGEFIKESQMHAHYNAHYEDATMRTTLKNKKFHSIN